MRPWYYFPFDLIVDCYWCFIPLRCRYCDYIKVCRKGFFKGRKCYNGCLEIKRRNKYLNEVDRKDYIDNLVKYVEEEEKK